MRPPHRGKKPKTDLQTSSGDESVNTHSSGLSDEDLDALLQLSKNTKPLVNPENGSSSSDPINTSISVQEKTRPSAKSLPQDPKATKRGQKTSQNSQDSGMHFILAGHANLHKAANNAAQMSMHIYQQFKNFKLNENGQIIKSSKVARSDKRKGKPTTVDEWNDQGNSAPTVLLLMTIEGMLVEANSI